MHKLIHDSYVPFVEEFYLEELERIATFFAGDNLTHPPQHHHHQHHHEQKGIALVAPGKVDNPPFLPLLLEQSMDRFRRLSIFPTNTFLLFRLLPPLAPMTMISYSYSMALLHVVKVSIY
jgi:hypothetical protein